MPVHTRYTSYIADQRQFFDELITEDWNAYASAEWDASRRFEVEQIFARIQPKTILDVGCGCGFHDQVLAEPAFVERVDAIDYSEQSIARADQVYPHGKVRRWVADLRELPVDQKYDLVTSFQVFEHLDRPADYFEACAMLCQPGGYIAISTPNRWRLDNVMRVLQRKKPLLLDPLHFAEYTAGQVTRMAAHYGFKKVDWFGYGFAGLDFISRWSFQRRLQAGYRHRHFAQIFCVVFQYQPAA